MSYWFNLNRCPFWNYLSSFIIRTISWFITQHQTTYLSTTYLWFQSQWKIQGRSTNAVVKDKIRRTAWWAISLDISLSKEREIKLISKYSHLFFSFMQNFFFSSFPAHIPNVIFVYRTLNKVDINHHTLFFFGHGLNPSFNLLNDINMIYF